jgi:hypothetical protein
MAISLFLNKIEVDISPRPITRKLRIGDVGDIEQRNSNFSYTINLPKTSRNISILEMLGVIGNESRKPFESIVCDYVVDSVYLVENGFAIIKSTSGFYKLNIIDGVKGMSELLAGKKLADLPLDDLNHSLTTQEYIDSFSHTDGFIYCMANYGLGVSSSIKVEEQAPSIYTHTLFRKIFEASGLNLIGDFFTTNDKYLNEVLTPAKGYEVIETPFDSIDKGDIDTDTLADQDESEDYIPISRDFTISSSGGLTGASIVDGKIKFSVAGTYKLSIGVNYTSEETFLYIYFKLNGSTKATLYLPDSESFPSAKSFQVTFIAEVDDEVSLHLIGGSEYPPEGEPFTVFYSVVCDGTLYLQEGGQLIEATDYIGDMNQIDFIKDIITRYGLILHPIQNSIDYRFESLEVLLNDRAGAEDWTDKMDVVENENYDSGYAKINKGVYQYPEAIVIPNNDGEMLIDNDNAENEKTIITSAFEIPVTSSTVGGEVTYLIPVWALEDAVVVNKETPLKVMHIKRVDTSVTAKLFDEVTGIAATEDVPFLNLDFMSMQYFIDTFYLSFKALIENYKAVDLSMNLSVVDIFNLDFFKLKYLKQTGRFYYLNNVQNTTGKVSKVNMVEISEFI